MRSILCLFVVCAFATTAAAQVGKVGTGSRVAAKPGDATQKKTANAKGNAGKAGAAEQAGVEAEVVDAILIAMDADHDGVVSQKEMTKALAALRKVPKDKQGNITTPEKDATDPNAAPDAGLAQGPNGAGAPADGRNNNEVMGRFMQMDSNHDGVLSPNEVPQQQQAGLRAADTNRDGVIDATEMQAFSRKMGARMKAFSAGGNPNQVGGVPGDGRKP